MGSLQLPPSPESPGRARAFTRTLLQEWGVHPDVIEDAELLVTEVVTNSVIHARTGIELSLSHADGVVRVSVADQSRSPARLQQPKPRSVTGRGLYIVDQLASEWSATDTPNGKVIDFALETHQRTRTSNHAG